MKNKMTPKKSAVLLELFYLENKRVNIQISGSHNEFLQDLGLSSDLSDRFSQAIGRYTALKSMHAGFSELLQLLGLNGDPRVNSYVNSAQSYQKSWLKKNILFLSIKAAGIHHSVVSCAGGMGRRAPVKFAKAGTVVPRLNMKKVKRGKHFTG